MARHHQDGQVGLRVRRANPIFAARSRQRHRWQLGLKAQRHFGLSRALEDLHQPSLSGSTDRKKRKQKRSDATWDSKQGTHGARKRLFAHAHGWNQANQQVTPRPAIDPQPPAPTPNRKHPAMRCDGSLAAGTTAPHSSPDPKPPPRSGRNRSHENPHATKAKRPAMGCLREMACQQEDPNQRKQAYRVRRRQ